LVIKFTELLKLATTIKGYSLTVLHTSQITRGHTSTRSAQSGTVFNRCCLVVASNVGPFPSSGLPNCPWPQLPASHSNISQQLNPSGYLTHSPTNHSTHLILVRLKHLNTDRIENTVPLLQCNCFDGNMLLCGAVTYQQLLYSCLFRGRCLATCLHVTIWSTCKVGQRLDRNRNECAWNIASQHHIRLEVCSYTCPIVLDSVLVSTSKLRGERREIFRECGCDHVKTSSYPCNTSSDVFSIKPVTSARLCSDPNPARAIRHRQEISRKKKRLGRYWITFFFSVACVNDRLWCNLSGHSSPDCTGAALLLVAVNTQCTSLSWRHKPNYQCSLLLARYFSTNIIPPSSLSILSILSLIL
jgi:hypothetical protein